MHARRAARDAYFPRREDDAFFDARRGDVVFEDTGAARRFAERVNAKDARSGDTLLRPAETAAMALVHEIFHVVIGIHRERTPASFASLLEQLRAGLGDGADETRLAFLRTFPPPAVYRVDETAEKKLAREGQKGEDEITEEILLLWLTNQNPAYEPVRAIVTDEELAKASPYATFVEKARTFFATEPSLLGKGGPNLIDLLLEPSRRAPKSIFGQLAFIEEEWGSALGLDRLPIWRRLLWARDFLNEEGKWFYKGGPGPGSPLLDPMRFSGEEPKRFSEDKGWMPNVVLIAKTVFVWLDQLSKKYRRDISRLDQVPDEELDLLARRGFNGLWLIGLFERSRASKKIKQMRGDQDAVASAYSLKGYAIADEIGGYLAYTNLRDRAQARGIRLAADMVPNHVGIDGDWVIEHPDWFLQARHPPFPSYRFGGADLSDDGRVGLFIEEGYWNHTDAAVVFRRHDRHTGEDRFIYHGNDGTSMPWNDTAQLDYTKQEVRQAVINTILHVASMFPIIRFDAAMTLAKKHYRRLWFPPPGQGGAIPSRSDYAMTDQEFERVFPEEFWRQVVDTVAERAPDTLLLAEAFWMMEGYFVRSLGMHRVYNSAFMNMLKREENGKYRATIRNVLDFDPEILKRFVNFMNNPDEETAVAQFGGDDKYFGVCTLMCTMPGLPMFGHGQVEGFHEKYGMEYRRAKWDEHPNEGFVERHEREIFPLLRKRWLFSGVDNFALYDFQAEGGGVDDDVFAYSNRVGDERALVLYNNKWKQTRGRVFWSTHKGQIATALGLNEAQGDWLVFRDLSKQLEYLRPMREVVSGGFYWELDNFKYHVFSEMRAVNATKERPYDKLAAELSGRGVPSIERALVEMRFRPVHQPLREAIGKGHAEYLSTAPAKDAAKAFEEKVGHLIDGLVWRLAQDGEERAVDRKVALAPARARFDAARAFFTASKTTDVSLLLAWLHVDTFLNLVASLDPGRSRGELAQRWELAAPLVDAFHAEVDGWESRRRAALAILAAILPVGTPKEMLAAAITDSHGRAFLNVHEADGATWLVKERFEELAKMLLEREVLLDRMTPADAKKASADLHELAEKAGFQADRIAAALAPPVPTKKKPVPEPPTSRR